MVKKIQPWHRHNQDIESVLYHEVTSKIMCDCFNKVMRIALDMKTEEDKDIVKRLKDDKNF